MKKDFLLFIIIAVIITSCSTAYKTGQTPDDVYYSPARIQTYEVRNDRDIRDDNTVYTNSDDREIRRRIRHRRYRQYDDGYNYPYGYYGTVYGNPKYGTTQHTSEPRKTNLGAYTPNSSAPDSVKINPKTGKFANTTTTSPVRTFANPGSSNNGTGVGNAIRRILNGANSSNNGNYNRPNNSNNSNSTPARTFDTRSSSNNNSSNNSNSKSSSSENKSSSAPVRTFKNN